VNLLINTFDKISCPPFLHRVSVTGANIFWRGRIDKLVVEMVFEKTNNSVIMQCEFVN